MIPEINLVIMAAGRASRFGGIKQLTPVGPDGECLMDYSIFDAKRLGFGKVIVVINAQIESQVEKHFQKVFGDNIKIELVIQDAKLHLDAKQNSERTKPWGTGQALLTAATKLNSAFVICNADDYYGYETLKKAADFLQMHTKSHALLAYRLSNTILEKKEYSRALAVIDPQNKLVSLKEVLNVRKQDDELFYIERNNKITVSASTLTSMNCWAFQYEIIESIKQLFDLFLKENYRSKTAEFLLPTAIETLVKQKMEEVTVIETGATWFGLTYAADVEFVKQNIRQEIKKGYYPESLWS